MSEFLPDGESLRKAILWVSELRREDPTLAAADLIDRASKHFDLSPLDQEFLLNALSRRSDA